MSNNRERKICVVGLGYVGLAVANSFAKQQKVIGYDTSKERVQVLQSGRDSNGEIYDLNLENLQLTTELEDTCPADFYIITVPTPITQAKQPDLSLVKHASCMIGQVLAKGDIVVYESTVYPGVTEDICLPILEEQSGLKCPDDFGIGYSPERINPGDTAHPFESISKIVSGYNDDILQLVDDVYASVIEAGIIRASNIKTAEAAKVIENTQRDLNIALMNELAIIFDKLGIDSMEVIAAAASKWNFHLYAPGLVGGHCIGVDPYYLTYKAEELGYSPRIILSGRDINDHMHLFIVEKTIKKLLCLHHDVSNIRIGILGITYKENCSDIRNSKVFAMMDEFLQYGVELLVHDPYVDADHQLFQHVSMYKDLDNVTDLNALVLAVPHQEYTDMPINQLLAKLEKKGLLIDIKSVLDRQAVLDLGCDYWSL